MCQSFIALNLLSCHKKETVQQPRKFPVAVFKAEKKDAPLFIEALGHIEPMTSIDIYSRVEGELTGVYFNQGSEVSKGDLLFTIDPKPYEAAQKKALGSLEKAKVNLALSEEKVRRYKSLAQDEFYSQIDYETLQAEMAANTAQVIEAEATLDKAKINLGYCSIYAPHSGMMGILNIDFGNLVCESCQKPLVTLNQMDPIFITFSIPEYQLYSVQKALKQSEGSLKVISAFESFEEETFSGKLEILNNEVDKDSGMIKLRGVFSNGKRLLWPGQFIRNRLILKTLQGVISIPYSAVQITQKGPIVFVVQDNGTVQRKNCAVRTKRR